MPRTYWTTTASCVFIVLLLTLTGCTSDRAAEQPQNVDTKLDPLLRQALRGDSEATLQVLIEVDEYLDDDKRRALEDAALVNISGSSRIVTAAGTPEAIRRAAALDFVRSVSLSQERPPLN